MHLLVIVGVHVDTLYLYTSETVAFNAPKVRLHSLHVTCSDCYDNVFRSYLYLCRKIPKWDSQPSDRPVRRSNH